MTPICVWDGPMLKRSTNCDMNALADWKPAEPTLPDPSTMNTISAIVDVLHSESNDIVVCVSP
ncbi:hypothetical protein DPMN_188280 [Dreissena polymorpha]|uniref:Uncharacterized protein n=1 Tax=Dreissena polymorpha TaxID=45954 RepID=A0A9D4I9S8_DREPO|nr:hypothetical protein DPMN_188280 [Dreissena polymorpha]